MISSWNSVSAAPYSSYCRRLSRPTQRRRRWAWCRNSIFHYYRATQVTAPYRHRGGVVQPILNASLQTNIELPRPPARSPPCLSCLPAGDCSPCVSNCTFHYCCPRYVDSSNKTSHGQLNLQVGPRNGEQEMVMTIEWTALYGSNAVM